MNTLQEIEEALNRYCEARVRGGTVRSIKQREKLMSLLQALADGRTRCIQPLSEEEHRARFNKMYDGFRLLPSSANYRENCFLVWLACARAMGAVSGEKK